MSEQPQQICDNCRKSFPQSKIATHFGYCRRNIKKCQQCGEMYDINFTQEHEQQFHKMSNCKFCKKTFKPNELIRHEGKCDAQTKFCQYCDLDVPIKEYSIHLKQCESRTKQCQKCRKPVSNKDFLIHTISCTGITGQRLDSKKYQNIIKYQQKRQELKKYQNKPYYQQIRRQIPKNGVERLGQKQRERQKQRQIKKQSQRQKKRVMEKQKEILTQKERQRQRKTQIYERSNIYPNTKGSNQNKPTNNYGDIKNLSEGEKKNSNIPEREKYRGIQQNKNIDIGKDINPAKIPQNKNQTNIRTHANQYQNIQPGKNAYKKPSSDIQKNYYGAGEVNGKVTANLYPSKEILSRQVNPSSKGVIYPQKSNFRGTQQNYKRQVFSNNQPKKLQNYGKYTQESRPEDATNNFKKDDSKKYQYQQASRNKPKQQTYIPNQSRQQTRTYIPPSEYTYVPQSVGDHDEDQQLQKAILASMGNMKISNKSSSQNYKYKKPTYIDDIPPELIESDMMNESFYGKQAALMQEFQRNKRKR